MAQMVLVSRECCQVARGRSSSSGLGLRKWVMICLLNLNKVAWGPNRTQPKPESVGRHYVVLGTDGACLQEQLMPRWHLKISRDIRACSVGIEAR